MNRSWLLGAGLGATLAAGAAFGQFSENWDSWATGQQMHGAGGWVGWDNSAAAGALTSAVQARSTPNSIDIKLGSDLVQTFAGIADNEWEWTCWMYIPTASTGTTYFILLSDYNHTGPYAWCVQLPFNRATGFVTDDFRTETPIALAYGRWAKIDVDINLRDDAVRIFYDGQLLSEGTWTAGQLGSTTDLEAVDLYANNTSTVYYDDIELYCRADYDHDGFPTGDDIALWVTDFENGGMGADYDHDGFLTGDDATLYVTAFEFGC